MATWNQPNPIQANSIHTQPTFAVEILPVLQLQLQLHPFIFPFPSFRLAASASDPLLRYKRQATTEETKKEESFEKELCKDKDAGEWFRLVAGEGDNCRDVIQCTSSVSYKLSIVVCKYNCRYME